MERQKGMQWCDTFRTLRRDADGKWSMWNRLGRDKVEEEKFSDRQSGAFKRLQVKK